MKPAVRSYLRRRDWEREWQASPRKAKRANACKFEEIASFLAGSLYLDGFRLFDNAGTPLLLRIAGELREEVVLVPGPRMRRREDMPFTVYVHLSSLGMSNVRSRFWRSAVRPPQVIASGDIGLLNSVPTYSIFSASSECSAGPEIADLLHSDVLPWFELFHDPHVMRDQLYGDGLPLVDESTALELLLFNFDPAEARRFLRYRELNLRTETTPIEEPSGFDLGTSRVDPIRAYYKLGMKV